MRDMLKSNNIMEKCVKVMRGIPKGTSLAYFFEGLF